MEKILSLFRQLDEFVFTKIDKFKSSNIYQQYSEQTSTMSEKSQKRLNQLLTFLVIVLPFGVLSIFAYSNYTIRESIKLNNDIVTAINDFSNKKTELQTIGNTVHSAIEANNQEIVSSRLRSIMQSKSISTEKLTVSNFDRQNVTGNIYKSSAELNFTDFSMADFITILYSVLQEDSAKVSTINIRKNKETTALEGSLTVLYYGRGTQF